jgi:hypothetical protein
MGSSNSAQRYSLEKRIDIYCRRSDMEDDDRGIVKKKAFTVMAA